MITSPELHRAAASEGLRFDQAEKDYVILWLLHALSGRHSGPPGWVFKGGTCLRHCYYKGYRFSEDLDYSCTVKSAGLEPALAVVNQAASKIQTVSGIRMSVKTPQTIPGDFQVEIPVEYSRGGMRTRGLPSVKVHLTFDEPILTRPVARQVSPQYAEIHPFKTKAYSKKEIVAEKMRALLQQQGKWPRPRDLYDLWFILCRSKENFDRSEIRELFVKKCQAREIEPDLQGLISKNLKEWNRGVWNNLLGPMLKTVPAYDDVWSEWTKVFRDRYL